MGLGLRGRAQKALERTADAVLTGSAHIAFHGVLRHKRHFGTIPNFMRPKTFSEKLLHRMIFDRRPILTRLQDKYAAREYVSERIGGHVLPALYWLTKDPTDIPLDDLPERYVVKAAHGCGWNYLVPDKTTLNKRDLIDTCASWLSWNYYDRLQEWAYKHIVPRIMVEEFISDDTGLSPRTYKIYVFNGQARLVWVLTKRFEPGLTRRPAPDLRSGCYSPSWEPLNITTPFIKPIERPVSRPPHLAEMIMCAEILGQGLDFIRVDLYDAQKVYFGEMTVHPGGGLEFTDPKWNRYFGELWELPNRQ